MNDTTHLIRNQDGHYWGRGKRWVDGREGAKVAVYEHRDEVVNTVFELSSKDIELRAEILDIKLEEGKLPKLEISDIPLPEDENTPELPLENSVSKTDTEEVEAPAAADNRSEDSSDNSAENAAEVAQP